MSKVTPREFDTILAALDLWSGYGARLSFPSARKYCHRNGAPLDRSEILALIQKLEAHEEEEESPDEGRYDVLKGRTRYPFDRAAGVVPDAQESDHEDGETRSDS